MKFVATTQKPITYEADTAYLIKGTLRRGVFDDSWNDYGYRTIYTIQYCDEFQQIIEVGRTGIGEFNMGEGQYSPNLPSEFIKLSGERFFSIAYEEDYYKNIAALQNDKGYDILLALNDFTMSSDVYSKAIKEKVTRLSLLRNVRESEYDNHIRGFYELLMPPINLTTMRRIFGSTGWDDIDSGLVEMQRLLHNANIHYYYNAIATIGREIIKGLANKIYNDDLHRDKEKYPAPSEDQYINKLHGFVDYAYAKTEISENVKKYLKSTIEMVQGYVHKDKAENFECFLCVHAVIALVFQLSILCKKDKYTEVTV